MTHLEVRYRYATPPREAEMRALDAVREVYGVRVLRLNEPERTILVEYDASRLKEPMVAGLLRRAGMDLLEKVAIA